MQTSDADRTLRNLYVIGALSHNDKLITNDDVFDIYPPTVLRGAMRTWYGERRDHNIQRVCQAVRAGMTIATSALEEIADLRIDSTEMRRNDIVHKHVRMCNAIDAARRGMVNLLQTYRDDAATASQVALLIQEMSDFATIVTPHTQRLCSGYTVVTQPVRLPYVEIAERKED